MTGDNQPDELPSKCPEVSALRTSDDAIWSPNFACARLAKSENELRQALIKTFGKEAGKEPIILPHEDSWSAHYHRNGYDGLVYWTGATPPPLPS